jgi:2-amino-4-hydroxy-6-hydroxymethyldihydropteridine diphosphokinase
VPISVFIGLGSNLQEPQQQINNAIIALKALPESHMLAVAPYYRSLPMGPADQPEYINTVVHLETELSALGLLDHLQAIELSQGRERAERWGARTLDLDLLLYGDDEISHPRLTVPHPGIAEREFVLYPLLDIAATLVIPGLGRLSELKDACAPNGIVRLAETS